MGGGGVVFLCANTNFFVLFCTTCTGFLLSKDCRDKSMELLFYRRARISNAVPSCYFLLLLFRTMQGLEEMKETAREINEAVVLGKETEAGINEASTTMNTYRHGVRVRSMQNAIVYLYCSAVLVWITNCCFNFPRRGPHH